MSNAIPFNRKEIKSLISKEFLIVILISTPSAILADYFKIPLAWMLGPMLAISIAKELVAESKRIAENKTEIIVLNSFIISSLLMIVLIKHKI